ACGTPFFDTPSAEAETVPAPVGRKHRAAFVGFVLCGAVVLAVVTGRAWFLFQRPSSADTSDDAPAVAEAPHQVEDQTPPKTTNKEAPPPQNDKPEGPIKPTGEPGVPKPRPRRSEALVDRSATLPTGPLKAQYQCDATSLKVEQIQMKLRIVNTGAEAVPL